jgi:hypothetical protein
MMIFDADDFGCNHEISDMCQSHDCRDVLNALHEANPAFKATLFAIPGEMTVELLEWSMHNASWIELAVHGFYHSSNYECEKMPYKEFNDWMIDVVEPFGNYFVNGFKAPGWQISDDVYRWLKDNGWWVADQAYNDDRRPKDLPVYKIGPDSVHTHTWNCVGNGIYQLYDELVDKISKETEFKFISEVINETN